MFHRKSISKEVPPGTKSSPVGPGRLNHWLLPQPHRTHLWLKCSPPPESVKPSSLPPSTVCDQNGFRILLHFPQAGAPGHPDVQVLLLTMMSTFTQPVWDNMIQVTVTKSMRVKLQPASSSKLPAFSP
ncbi:ADP-ribosylation factor-binding protein GGA2 [Lemmus lemmus]